MDATDLLAAEHPMIGWLLDEYEQFPAEAHRARATTVERLRIELTIYLGLTEQIFYPAVRSLVPELDGAVLEQLEVARTIGRLCREIVDLAEDDLRFDAKERVLARLARAHLATETDIFSSVRTTMDPQLLDELGRQLAQLRPILAADPRPDPLGRPVAALSAAATMVIETAARTLEGASARLRAD